MLCSFLLTDREFFTKISKFHTFTAFLQFFTNIDWLGWIPTHNRSQGPGSLPRKLWKLICGFRPFLQFVSSRNTYGLGPSSPLTTGIDQFKFMHAWGVAPHQIPSCARFPEAQFYFPFLSVIVITLALLVWIFPTKNPKRGRKMWFFLKVNEFVAEIVENAVTLYRVSIRLLKSDARARSHTFQQVWT